jgi:serine/threonine protein kinase
MTPTAPMCSERLITDDSAYQGLTPRSKNMRKLTKLIKLGFKQNPPIPPATTIDFYRIGKILGKGAFGKVNLAIHKLTQCVCAIKSINK